MHSIANISTIRFPRHEPQRAARIPAKNNRTHKEDAHNEGRHMDSSHLTRKEARVSSAPVDCDLKRTALGDDTAFLSMVGTNEMNQADFK